MACFLVPAAEAVVTTVATKVVSGREAPEAADGSLTLSAEVEAGEMGAARVPMARKLRWLSTMLWGGSALLALEHLWHGEVTLTFPFLTAASDPASLAEALAEMSTVGVAMALVVTAVWAVMTLVADRIASSAAAPEATLGRA